MWKNGDMLRKEKRFHVNKNAKVEVEEAFNFSEKKIQFLYEKKTIFLFLVFLYPQKNKKTENF